MPGFEYDEDELRKMRERGTSTDRMDWRHLLAVSVLLVVVVWWALA